MILDKKRIYINAATCISCQNTFEGDFLTSNMERLECSNLSKADFDTIELEKLSSKKYILAKDSEFKKYIPAQKLRRMCTIIRRGLLSSIKVLKDAKIEMPDAIIVGTSLGCLHETVSFLETMSKEGENFLNPSNFVQSTHNTIAGNIALYFGCNNYNMTFSQKNISFESALIDSLAMFREGEINNVLLGGIDEIDSRIADDMCKLPCYKNKILSEGNAFFVLSDTPSNVELLHQELSLRRKIDIIDLLKKYDVDDVDLIVSGEYNNEKEYDEIKKIFPNSNYIKYKHYFGEFDTVTSIGLWLAYEILCLSKKKFKNCLIYNANSTDESIILLQRTK